MLHITLFPAPCTFLCLSLVNHYFYKQIIFVLPCSTTFMVSTTLETDHKFSINLYFHVVLDSWFLQLHLLILMSCSFSLGSFCFFFECINHLHLFYLPSNAAYYYISYSKYFFCALV
jgi:hypothetical protein